MKPTRQVPFDRLIDLFIKVSGHHFELDPSTGQGSVRVFPLERGLEARLWDCTFTEGIELYSAPGAGDYFTLAFFLETGDLQFADGPEPYRKHPLWNNLFLAGRSDCRMCVVPGMRVHCLGISFSRRWLDGVLRGSAALEKMKKRIYASDNLSVHGTMSLAERDLVLEVINSSWSRQLGSFYIKSTVLKMISDFFCRLKERDCFDTKAVSTGSILAKIEEFLSHHITGNLPNLKTLAQTFSMSEATLKRLFKKRYGVSMTTYFLQKKMEYARRIMQESCLTLTEAARRVGYRSTQNFISMLRKYSAPYEAAQEGGVSSQLHSPMAQAS